MSDEIKKSPEVEAEAKAMADAEAKSTETKIEITSELVDRIVEAVAKTKEASKKAKKEVRFHGTEASEKKLEKAEEAELSAKFISEMAKGKNINNSEVIAKVHASRAKAIRGDVDANGGYLVPNAFETNIYATFDSYSEIIADADVQTFDRPGRVFDLNELSTRVTVYRVSPDTYAGVTASTPTFTEPQLAVANYMGSTVITQDLMEDEENDVMSNLSRQYGEQMAKVFQNVLVNSTITVSGVVSSGIAVKGNGATTVTAATTASGYTAVGAGDLEKVYFTAIAEDHFQDANKDGKFYMHPLVMQSLRANIRTAGTDNDYISLFDGNEPSIMGRPIVYTNQMPTPATTVSDPYIVYGNLNRHLKIRRKRGVTMKINDSGTALDGTNLNYQLGRELVVSQRIGAQLVLKSGLVHLITN